MMNRNIFVVLIVFAVFLIMIEIADGANNRPTESVFIFRSVKKIKEVTGNQILRSDPIIELPTREMMQICRNVVSSTYFQRNNYRLLYGVQVDRVRQYKISDSLFTKRETISAYRCPIEPAVFIQNLGRVVMVFLEKPKGHGWRKCSDKDSDNRTRSNESWFYKFVHRVQRLFHVNTYDGVQTCNFVYYDDYTAIMYGINYQIIDNMQETIEFGIDYKKGDHTGNVLQPWTTLDRIDTANIQQICGIDNNCLEKSSNISCSKQAGTTFEGNCQQEVDSDSSVLNHVLSDEDSPLDQGSTASSDSQRDINIETNYGGNYVNPKINLATNYMNPQTGNAPINSETYVHIQPGSLPPKTGYEANNGVQPGYRFDGPPTMYNGNARPKRNPKTSLDRYQIRPGSNYAPGNYPQTNLDSGDLRLGSTPVDYYGDSHRYNGYTFGNNAQQNQNLYRKGDRYEINRKPEINRNDEYPNESSLDDGVTSGISGSDIQPEVNPLANVERPDRYRFEESNSSKLKSEMSDYKDHYRQEKYNGPPKVVYNEPNNRYQDSNYGVSGSPALKTNLNFGTKVFPDMNLEAGLGNNRRPVVSTGDSYNLEEGSQGSSVKTESQIQDKYRLEEGNVENAVQPQIAFQGNGFETSVPTGKF